jgi:hypothetical protein
MNDPVQPTDGSFYPDRMGDSTDGTSAPPAGWYDDPEDAGKIRFFDGVGWTESRAPRPVAFPPKGESPPLTSLTSYRGTLEVLSADIVITWADKVINTRDQKFSSPRTIPLAAIESVEVINRRGTFALRLHLCGEQPSTKFKADSSLNAFHFRPKQLDQANDLASLIAARASSRPKEVHSDLLGTLADKRVRQEAEERLSRSADAQEGARQRATQLEEQQARIRSELEAFRLKEKALKAQRADRRGLEAAAKQERKAQREETRSREAAAKQKRKAQEAFRRTPQGQARAAKERGMRTFQWVSPLETTERSAFGVVTGDKDSMKTRSFDHASTIEGIESEGWKLKHMNTTWKETGTVSRDKLLSSGQAGSVQGEVLAIYVFEAALLR